MNRVLTAALVLTVGSSCRGTQSPAPPSNPGPAAGTEAAITEKDLQRRLYLIADDSTLGRETGSEGAFKTSTYIAAEFQRLGLEPAGDNGTYFQAVPFWDVLSIPARSSRPAKARRCDSSAISCRQASARRRAFSTARLSSMREARAIPRM